MDRKKKKNFTVYSSTLRHAIDANTQAQGKNTLAVEEITQGLKDLAKETGDWRKEDKKHHAIEKKKDDKKLKLIGEALKLLRQKK